MVIANKKEEVLHNELIPALLVSSKKLDDFMTSQDSKLYVLSVNFKAKIDAMETATEKMTENIGRVESIHHMVMSNNDRITRMKEIISSLHAKVTLMDEEKAALIEIIALHSARMDGIEASVKNVGESFQTCSLSQEYVTKLELDHKALNLLSFIKPELNRDQDLMSGSLKI